MGYRGLDRPQGVDQALLDSEKKNWNLMVEEMASVLPVPKITTMPPIPTTPRLFDFLKWSYCKKLEENPGDAKLMRRLQYLKSDAVSIFLSVTQTSIDLTTQIKFGDIFRPCMRATAAGTMGLTSPFSQPLPDDSEKEFFPVNTDLSLFFGLSGSPVISFNQWIGRWQVVAIGKVRNSRRQ